MKTRTVRDRRAGALSLSVRPQKGEAVDYALAEWLRSADEPYLLDFSYTLEGRESELFFDLTGTEALPRYLKQARLTSAQFQSMLCAVRELLALCTKRSMATSFVRFDADMVRVAEGGDLKLALIPLTGVPAVAANTPSELLRFLAEKSRFVVGDDARHADAVLDFVRRNAVLSLTALDGFLKEEYGTVHLRSEGSGGTGSQALGSSSLGASSGRLSGSGRLREAAPARSTTGTARAAYDAISMVLDAPSAAEVIGRQGVSDRVRDGISGTSPTAGPRTGSLGLSSATVDAALASAPPVRAVPASGRLAATGNTGVTASGATSRDAAPTSFSAPSPASMPAAGPASAPASVSHAQVGYAQGTTLLSIPAFGKAASASTTPARSLVRERDGKRFDLPNLSECVLGRSKTCDVSLEGNSNISRRHASVVCEGVDAFLVDLGSANGTAVGGEALPAGERIRLTAGTSVMLADERFTYLET